MMKEIVTLSGSFNGNPETLMEKVKDANIMQISFIGFIGREITFRVTSDAIENAKKVLGDCGVTNITLLEWKRDAVILEGSGSGSDSKKIVEVSLIPLFGGMRSLAVINPASIDEKTVSEAKRSVEETLSSIGITDAGYIVGFKSSGKDSSGKKRYGEAAKIATLNAIIDCGGIKISDRR